MPAVLLEQLRRLVRPALREYGDAEQALSRAHETGDPAEIEDARLEVMRRARTAAIELNHFADFALKERSALFPPSSAISDVRSAVQARCMFLRGSRPVEDVSLLRNIAEAFKHHELDRVNATVRRADIVIAATTAFGGLSWGEGKFGGGEQVIVTTTTSDTRALSSVLQNVYDAWLLFLNQPLSPIGEFG
jgi:hypothetical protein